VGPYLVGVDIGGTFTDCVVLDRTGNITATKAASTPGNFADGMLAAMRVAAERLKLPFDVFCEQISILTHGTTVGTNAVPRSACSRPGVTRTRSISCAARAG
jgi:N-methylhydantoinase A